VESVINTTKGQLQDWYTKEGALGSPTVRKTELPLLEAGLKRGGDKAPLTSCTPTLGSGYTHDAREQDWWKMRKLYPGIAPSARTYAYDSGMAHDGMKKHAIALLDALQTRFPNTTLVGAFHILTPGAYVDKYKDDAIMQGYGADKMEMLIEHYGTKRTTRSATGVQKVHQAKIKGDLARTQFACYKTYIKNELQMHFLNNKDKELLVYETWFQTHGSTLRTQLSEVYKLMEIAYVLPMTSVDCERGFSDMNNIKNTKRSKLGDAKLAGLMRIVGAGRKTRLSEWPDSFWTTCLSMWQSTSARRIDMHVPQEPARPQTVPVDSDDESTDMDSDDI
jgi:hypothetical protein